MKLKATLSQKDYTPPSLWTLLKDINCLVLFGCTFVMAMGTHLINPVIPEIISYFKVSELRASLVISLFTFPSIILSPLVGSLADKYGHKIFLVIGMLIFGVPGILPLFFDLSFNSLLIIRFVQGIGFSTMPLTIAAFGDLYVGSQEVAAQGMRNFFLSAGGFLFPILGGSLALLGWNYPFIAFWLVIPFTFLTYRYFSEPLKQNNEEPINLKHFLKGLKGIRDPYVLLSLISSLLRFFISVGIRFYLPIFLVTEFSANLALVGLILGFSELVKALIALLVGNITAYWGMNLPFVLGFLVQGLSCFFLPVVPSIGLIFVLMGIIGLADGILAPLQKSLVTQNTSKENRGFVVSINASMQSIGRTISPVVLGVIMTSFGLSWTFWSMALISLIPVLHFYLKVNRS